MESITITREVKLSKNYNSMGTAITFQSEIRENESPDQAYERIVNFVDEKLGDELGSMTEVLG